MRSGYAIVERLMSTFPQRTVEGEIVPHDCAECSMIRKQLAGASWQEIPSEFMRENPDVLPLLSREAYVAYLPAWLRQGVLDPNGEVAGMLLVHLRSSPRVARFSSEQMATIIGVAKFIAENNIFGPEDPVNGQSVAEIERLWSAVTA